MKYQKIISFVVALTLVMALLAMPAHAAIFVENGGARAGSESYYDASYGDVAKCKKFGSSDIYNMYFTGNAYTGTGASKGPYRMFIKDDITSVNYADMTAGTYYIETGYIALDESNYKNAFSVNPNVPGIHFGHMVGDKWAAAKTHVNLNEYVDDDVIFTDRLTKFDYVITKGTTANTSNKWYVNAYLYLNNKLYASWIDVSSSNSSFNKFVISLQNPVTATSTPSPAINIYGGNLSDRIVTSNDIYVPNNGTGALTSTGALAEYAPGFTPGKNFYVPAGTTVADILEMESTYKTFELRSEDGTVITEASEDSAIGCYIYSVGEGNNTDDMGLYSKICEYVPTTLVKDAETKTFTASGIADGKVGSLIVAQFDRTSKTLTKVLYVSEINESGYYEKAYTVEDYDASSIYRAFLWKMPEMTPIINFEEF